MYISNSNNRTKTHLRYYITIRSKRCLNERISCRTVLEGIEEPCLLRTCRNRTQITNSVRNWTTGCFHHSAYTVFEEQLNNCSIEFTNVNLRLCYSAATNQKKKTQNLCMLSGLTPAEYFLSSTNLMHTQFPLNKTSDYP